MSNIITGDNCEQLVSLQVSPKGNWRKRLAFMNVQRDIGN